VVKT